MQCLLFSIFGLDYSRRFCLVRRPSTFYFRLASPSYLCFRLRRRRFLVGPSFPFLLVAFLTFTCSANEGEWCTFFPETSCFCVSMDTSSPSSPSVFFFIFATSPLLLNMENPFKCSRQIWSSVCLSKTPPLYSTSTACAVSPPL